MLIWLVPFFTIIAVLLTMAYMTYFERRIIGWMQLRQGPNRVGPLGLLQPIVDAIKLVAKKKLIPRQAQRTLFFIAPMISFGTSLIVWTFLPLGLEGSFLHSDFSLLWVFSITSLGVYGILTAGWSSNSKYALLGAVRAGSQVLSYELAMSLIFLCVIMLAGSFDLEKIITAQKGSCLSWNAFLYPHLFILYMICGFAETNRSPFDIAEGESELVAGYHVEYGGWSFALFFLAEYINMIVIAVIATILFLGGPGSPFSSSDHLMWTIFKTALLLFTYFWVRATLPRYRYDQLMSLGWCVLIPFATVNVIALACGIYFLA